MDYTALQNSIKRQLFSPVYLFYGDETYLQEKTIEQIKETLLPPEVRDFCLDILEGREVSAETVAQTASTMPFMAEKRLVIVKEAQFFKAKGKSKGEENGEDKGHAQEAKLLQYLENPSPYTCLIFLTNDTLDKRKKLYKQVEKAGQTVEFAPLRGNELRTWLTQKAQEKGKKFEGPALAKLAEGGTSLRQLEGEVDKLATYVGTVSVITLNDVEAVATKPVESTIFELVDALGEKKADKAIGILHKLLQDGEPPVRILFMIARQFRLILRAKSMGQEGYTEKQVASTLQIHPYVAQKVLRQSRNFLDNALQNSLVRILDADISLKSSQQKPALVLELLILNLVT